jgi:hypothetical protein
MRIFKGSRRANVAGHLYNGYANDEQEKDK